MPNEICEKGTQCVILFGRLWSEACWKFCTTSRGLKVKPMHSIGLKIDQIRWFIVKIR
jgi:hypothetical protein